MYQYFISYFFRKGEDSGFGSTAFECADKVDWINETKQIAKELSEMNGYDKCAIINFKELNDGKEQ